MRKLANEQLGDYLGAVSVDKGSPHKRWAVVTLCASAFRHMSATAISMPSCRRTTHLSIS